jgi:RES domain-containing protein
MIIEVPDTVKKEIIKLSDLPSDWREFAQMPLTQSIGENWLSKAQTAILQVPSSIIEEEVNYLINPQHPDFRKVKLLRSEKFVFDMRIKNPS